MSTSNHVSTQLALLKAEVEQMKVFVKSILTPKGLENNGVALDNRFDHLGIMIDQLDLAKDLDPSLGNQHLTFAAAAKKKSISKMLIIQPGKGKDTSVEDIGKQINQAIKINKDIQVEKVYATKQSVKVISFDSKIKEKLQKQLNDAGSDYEVISNQ